jgi:hypothetical protein
MCNHRRNYRVWAVEVFFIAASVFISYSPPLKLNYWLGMVVLAYFGVVVLIDLEYRLIMHPVSIFGAVLGLIVGTLRVGWLYSLVGGVVGFGIMWLIYMLGILIIKLVNRKRGRPVNDVALGFGDVNLSGVLGLMLGWPLIWIGRGSISGWVGQLNLYTGYVSYPKIPCIYGSAIRSFPGAWSSDIDIFSGSAGCIGRWVIHSFGKEALENR